MVTGFEVAVAVEGRVATFAVHGELDIATTPRLREAVEGALRGGAAELVVDLTPTGFVDSTACGYLLALAREAASGGPPARFVCPESNWDVWRVFEILGLLPMLGLA